LIHFESLETEEFKILICKRDKSEIYQFCLQVCRLIIEWFNNVGNVHFHFKELLPQFGVRLNACLPNNQWKL
jgi:hypothetical protein